MSAQRDPELDRLGDERSWDLDLRELGQYLRATPHPYAHVEPTPQFRQALHRRLMREAWEQASKPVLPWYRRVLAPQPMAWTAAAVGAVLIVFVAFFFAAGPRQTDEINVSVTLAEPNAQLVSTVQPIDLNFSQPMDTSSVHVQIQPATQFVYQWQGSTLKITPVNGLSANTQYQVTVTSARTASQKPVAKIQPVIFSTGPAPTPTPSAGPKPTPQPLPVVGAREIAPIGGLPSLWSADGSSLFVVGPTGQLQQYPLQGGTVQKVADGVALAAVAPDGSVAWVSSTGQVTWKTLSISGAQPIALGFRQGGLLMATATDVETSDQKREALLKETASAADFSPAGDRLAYLGASGLHVVDLTSGRDTLLGRATGLGDWSADDRHFAYPTDAGVAVADSVAATTGKLLDLPGVTGLTWSPGNQLLMSTASSLYSASYNADGGPTTARKLQDGAFGQPDWAPNGTGQFSFRRSGQVWVARLQGAVQGAATPAPGISQEDLVDAFMTARQNELVDQATSFLDAAGQAAFSKFNLIYTDPSMSLARYYVVLSQPGRVVVRLVLGKGQVETAIDETLVIQQDASSGQARIHSVTENPRTLFATGPEVVSVVVTSGQVQVVFDSDLQPNSAQSSVISIKGVAAQSSFDSRLRTVTLIVPGGLNPGTTYDLLIGSGLQDVNERHAVPYDLQLTGPSS
jgi:hypothetical protein